jgi:hypothetical protein
MDTPLRFPFVIKRVSVLCLHGGTDKITIYFDGPTTFPIMKYELGFSTEAQHGSGAQWVRDNLYIEPEVINVD